MDSETLSDPENPTGGGESSDNVGQEVSMARLQMLLLVSVNARPVPFENDDFDCEQGCPSDVRSKDSNKGFFTVK